MKRKIIYYTAVILSVGLIAGNIAADYSVEVLAAEIQGGLSMESEISQFLNSYYTARAEGDEGVIRELNESVEDSEIFLYKIMHEEGMEEFKITDFKFYPLDGKKTEGIICVFYDMGIQGITTKIPGMETLCIYQSDGGWKAKTGHVEDYSQQIQELEELTEDVMAVEERYEQVLKQDEELVRWLSGVEERLSDLTGSYVEKKDEGTEGRTAAEKSYTVKTGDCLWSIAKEQLKDARLWKDIYRKNQNVIGSSPELILPGQEFDMPQ